LALLLHNVELRPGRGGQIARSAGSSVQWSPQGSEYASVKMPSGEIRQINMECFATIGQVGNIDHENVSIGKAGRSRWLGQRRTSARGHEPGRPPAGRRRRQDVGRPVSGDALGPADQGYKTRNSKSTDKFIVQRRPE